MRMSVCEELVEVFVRQREKESEFPGLVHFRQKRTDW